MRTNRKRHHKIGDAHVRLYGFELNTPAYRSFSPDARALLVEFRALFNGGENRVFLSIRQMMERVGIGQRRAVKAREQLLERGWVRMINKGAFTRKVKHATEFVLTNVPLTESDGATAPKDYMRWQPSEKNTVAVLHTVGSCPDYREPSKVDKNSPDGSRADYREPDSEQITVAATATQILLPQGHTGKDSKSSKGNPVKRSKVAA